MDENKECGPYITMSMMHERLGCRLKEIMEQDLRPAG